MRSLSQLVVSSLILLGACGPSRARPDPGAGAGSGSGSGSGVDVAATNPAGCPATYGAVAVGTSCTDTAAACGFAEGDCWCGPRSYCGGVAPSEELLRRLGRPTWQCKPVRTDGCPEAQPSGACATPGEVCVYGDCCFTQLTCHDGTWTPTGGGCPP